LHGDKQAEQAENKDNAFHIFPSDYFRQNVLEKNIVNVYNDRNLFSFPGIYLASDK